MKKNLAVALLCVGSVLGPEGSFAGDTKPAAEEKKPATADLVEAAKDAKARRKKSTTKVLTNKDVKKSKARLIETGKTEPEKQPGAESPKPVTLAEQDARRRARIAAEERVAGAEQQVADLEKELDRLEQRYYEENDPNYRDNVIQDRFTRARRLLDDANRELLDARDALRKIENPSS